MPVKKLQLEEKKKDRKAKADSAKESAQKKRNSTQKQNLTEEQPDMSIDNQAKIVAATEN